jgi:hypothetical protein
LGSSMQEWQKKKEIRSFLQQWQYLLYGNTLFSCTVQVSYVCRRGKLTWCLALGLVGKKNVGADKVLLPGLVVLMISSRY